MKRNVSELASQFETIRSINDLSDLFVNCGINKKQRTDNYALVPVKGSYEPTETVKLDDPFQLGNVYIEDRSYSKEEVIKLINKRENTLHALFKVFVAANQGTKSKTNVPFWVQ